MRCFAALEVDDAVRSELVRFQEELRGEFGPGSRCIKWVKPENIHVTLKFLGEVSDQEITGVCRAVESGCRGFCGFSVEVGGSGSFGRGRVVWARADGGDELLELHESVEQALEGVGFERDRKKFSGHITLCRVKDFRLCRKVSRVLEGFAEREFGNLWVDSVCIYKSELTKAGPLYNLIQRTML